MGQFVRWLLPNDHDSIADIERQSYRDAMSASDIIALANEPQHICFVCLPSGGTALVEGFILYRVDRDHGCMEIVRLGVLRDSRLMGVGASLIDRVKSKLTARHSYIVAAVDESNVDGLLFLKACGFVPDAEQMLEDRVIMRLSRLSTADNQ